MESEDGVLFYVDGRKGARKVHVVEFRRGRDWWEEYYSGPQVTTLAQVGKVLARDE